MVLEFIGADREVTGSCHYLTFGDTHILIDCGMEQGADLYVNQEIPVNPSLIDYVFVTHALRSFAAHIQSWFQGHHFCDKGDNRFM